MPPTRDLAHNPGMCPDWKMNWRPFGSQAGTQSTEPHQPGPPILKRRKLKIIEIKLEDSSGQIQNETYRF